MKTQLQSPAELCSISVFAEVAVWESRPELKRLFAAGEPGGKIVAAIIATALPGLSASACRNLLGTLEHMRLIDKNGTIADFGRRCASSGEAPAWELGVFTFLVARHPCFGAWPIALRRDKPDGRDRDFDDLEEVPPWFAANPRRIWTSALEDNQRFTIASFPALAGQVVQCRQSALPPARLFWDIDLGTGNNLLHVEGDIVRREGNAVHFRTTDQTVPETEVAGLFSSWEPRWNGAAGRLLLPYDGAANKDGRDDFLRTLSYKNVKTGARGTFESARVEGVPVGPPGAPEAREWATALALARVGASDAYVAPSEWRKSWDTLVAGTPLHPAAGAPPEVSRLLDGRPTLSPRVRWLLAAGTDLAME